LTHNLNYHKYIIVGLTLFFLALSSSNSKNENDAADELICSLHRDTCAPAGVFYFWCSVR